MQDEDGGPGSRSAALLLLGARAAAAASLMATESRLSWLRVTSCRTRSRLMCWHRCLAGTQYKLANVVCRAVCQHGMQVCRQPGIFLSTGGHKECCVWRAAVAMYGLGTPATLTLLWFVQMQLVGVLFRQPALQLGRVKHEDGNMFLYVCHC